MVVRRVLLACTVVFALALPASASAATITLTDANSQSAGSVNWPEGISAGTAAGEAWVVERNTGRILRKGADAATFSLAFSTAGGTPIDVVVDSVGNVYVSHLGFNDVRKYAPDGTLLGGIDNFNRPTGLAFDGAGNLLVGEWDGQRLWKVPLSAWQPGVWRTAGSVAPVPTVEGFIGDIDVEDGVAFLAVAGSRVIKRIEGSTSTTFGGFSGDPLGISVENGKVYVAQRDGVVQVRSAADPATTTDTFIWSGSQPHGVLATGDEVFISSLTFGQVRRYLWDSDSDRIGDSTDNCPAVSNEDQADVDGDGRGDACDTFDNRDGDSDGISNGSDNCPAAANADQLDTDADGAGDACDSEDNRDTDGDGVQNHADNCVDTPNAGQQDTGGNELGDACDGDYDGVANAQDNCANTANAGQADVDADGAGDACDAFDDRDTDGDGVKNGADNCIDDVNPDQADVDGDGAGNACDAVNDLDLDNDGTDDGVDNCAGVTNPDQVDTDADGEGDACDTDDDGDGFADGVDACSKQFGTAANGCPMPTKKELCKLSGWKSYGSTFRSEGDCVSYVATRGKNQPAEQR